ncbi:MAG: acyl--CoA ligase [Alphaproteobacteria bacterium]|nr:acyl--CoA ligase [Alphaproteobacteria bacterium]
MSAHAALQTLDLLFQSTLAQQPERIALRDPLNKEQVTGRPPRQLTYAEADREIQALSTHFVELGLPVNSVIALHLPNTVEFILTLLAAHRAGLVVAILPLLWRHTQLTAALNRTAARAIVTMGTIDGIAYADEALAAAADAFSIRHICGFGARLPHGMSTLDDVLTRPPRSMRNVIQDGRKGAIISFDMTTEGVRLVPRPHFSVIAGGLLITVEAIVPQGATVMSAFAPSSFAGIASSLVLWLLSEGTLALHHPFNNDVLLEQFNAQNCSVLVAPGEFALRLAHSGLAGRMPALRRVIGLWRAPEQVALSAPWPFSDVSFTDVYLFGETGLFAVRRDLDGCPRALALGPQGTQQHSSSPSIACEVALTSHGTVTLRGPMVPVSAYAPPRPLREALAAEARHDYVDTGYAARIEPDNSLSILAAPSGIVSVGGYRFLPADMRECARRLGEDACLTALPDPLNGHRLQGESDDNRTARESLAGLGHDLLTVDAFRDHSP